jgi:hypothetical protein
MIGMLLHRLIQALFRMDSRGEGAAMGAAMGGIKTLFKNSSTYIIDGDLVKWKAFSEMILK